MVRIAISVEAFEAIALRLPVGPVAVEPYSVRSGAKDLIIMFHGSTSPADKQRAVGVLTEGTNLPDAAVPGVTDKQRAVGVLTEGANLPDAAVLGITGKQ